MSVRTVVFELEAKLKGGAGGLFSKPGGKLERKVYSDSGERLKISLRNLKVPDDSVAVVKADDLEIARLTIRKGAGRTDQESPGPGTLPQLEAGQDIAVEVNGSVILNGRLQLD